MTLIEGGTGCGKSTQVIQYLTKEAAFSGEQYFLLCTQPRRLAAINIAERVAKERNEYCGEYVGYHVRNDALMSTKTGMMFGTLGVLLRQLESGGDLEYLTHILVDEVH